jgi:hypothetical protein
MWLTKLKTALVLEEFETISKLLDEMPQFEMLSQMEEAAYLLLQCKAVLEHRKSETGHALQQLKNTIDFIKSTQTVPPHSLNLKF